MTDSIDEMAKLRKSEIWMTDYAEALGLTMAELITAADDFLAYDEYLIDEGRYEGMSTSPEFWDHYEVIKNTKVRASDRENFFSCSC